MTYPFPPDLKELVSQRMSTGQYDSEEDLLRDALHALDEEQEDLVAVREAVAEWQAGDPGVPLDEAFDRIRKKQDVS